MVVVLLSTLVTSITYTIGLFEKIATTYAWLKKVASTKWKEELDKFIKYLQVVKEVTTPYETSNCSKTAITGAVKLLDEELKESWSKVDEWMPTTRVYKQLMADDFINEMKSSRTTIHQNLQLFSTAVQTYREQEKKEFEEEEKEKEKEKEREENEYKDWLAIFFGIACLVVITKWTVITIVITKWTVITNWTVIFFRIIAKWTEIFSGIACLIAFSYVKLRLMEVRRKRRKLEKEKEIEKEKNEYKAWLEENITELTEWTLIFFRIACLQVVINYLNSDKPCFILKINVFVAGQDGWPSYKTGWEGATNSKLDLAERKRLFENHVAGLFIDYLKIMRLSCGWAPYAISNQYRSGYRQTSEGSYYTKFGK